MSVQVRLAEPPRRQRVMIEPITVRIPDAIQITGIGRSRIYELIKSGDLEAVKVGASTLILVASLRGFIEKCRATS